MTNVFSNWKKINAYREDLIAWNVEALRRLNHLDRSFGAKLWVYYPSEFEGISKIKTVMKVKHPSHIGIVESEIAAFNADIKFAIQCDNYDDLLNKYESLMCVDFFKCFDDSVLDLLPQEYK